MNDHPLFLIRHRRTGRVRCILTRAYRATPKAVLLICAGALVTGFAVSSHPALASANVPPDLPPGQCVMPASPPTLSCPVCPAPVACPVMPTEPPFIEPNIEVTKPEIPRGRLERAAWHGMRDWNADDTSEALTAFEQGCPVLKSRPEWADVCDKATALVGTKFTKQAAATFFRDNFQPFKVYNADDSSTGTVTGYYEPLLRGSRTRTDVYSYPIYATPRDLVVVELADLYADLKFRRLRGRILENKLVPYYDRAEIDSPRAPLKGLEIVWVDNPVELFFLQIQGSGQVQLPDGSRIRLGYAEQNGRPFRSLGGVLIRRGEIRPEHASMQGIKAWAERNPHKLQQYMNANPSYVFFKEIPSRGSTDWHAWCPPNRRAFDCCRSTGHTAWRPGIFINNIPRHQTAAESADGCTRHRRGDRGRSTCGFFLGIRRRCWRSGGAHETKGREVGITTARI